MRIVAGQHRSRRLVTPPGKGVRPTSDRAREAIFASLGAAVIDARVLDLFAGSGALGLEALSRGASSCHFVERNAEALVFCFPTWCFGLPAMLKGYFDRVLMPGVAFDLTDPQNVKPSLTHIKRISAVVTYGRPRWTAWYMGDPPRKMITRYLKLLTGNSSRTDYHAHYHMNVATPSSLNRFKEKVGLAMANFR